MLNEFENEIYGIWEEQPRESQRISLDQIRAKAQRAETRRRRMKTLGTAFFILLVIENCVEVVWPGQNIMERAGDLLIVAALFYIYYEYRKYARVASMPEGLGRTNSVEFYRAHLIYERNLARQSSRYLLPFVPGVTLSLLSGVIDEGVSTARLIGIATIGVALFLSIAWWNARTVRNIQKEMDALDTR